MGQLEPGDAVSGPVRSPDPEDVIGLASVLRFIGRYSGSGAPPGLGGYCAVGEPWAIKIRDELVFWVAAGEALARSIAGREVLGYSLEATVGIPAAAAIARDTLQSLLDRWAADPPAGRACLVDAGSDRALGWCRQELSLIAREIQAGPPAPDRVEPSLPEKLIRHMRGRESASREEIIEAVHDSAIVSDNAIVQNCARASKLLAGTGNRLRYRRGRVVWSRDDAR